MRRRDFTRTASLLAVIGLTPAPAIASAARPLAPFAWAARPLLVFAPTARDERAREQLDLFARHKAALAEREVPLIAVLGATVRIDGAPSVIRAETLRAEYRVEHGEFAVLLVGKDTGVKLRRAGTVAPREIFDLIDSMPMRRQEMRRRTAG